MFFVLLDWLPFLASTLRFCQCALHAHLHTHTQTRANTNKRAQPTNAEHLRSVNDMGIVLVALADGKVQLVHSFYNVRFIPRKETLDLLVLVWFSFLSINDYYFVIIESI